MTDLGLLYRSKNLASIDFAEYIPGLVSNLFSTYDISERQIALETRVESISLDIDRAIPCGLIINELVSNALNYAFPAATTGKIDVEANATSRVSNVGTSAPQPAQR